MADALNAFRGAKKTGVARRQEILTCPWILDAAREALGGEICHDPCASTNPKKWFATQSNITLPTEAQVLTILLSRTKDEEEAARIKAALNPYYLNVPTRVLDRSFVNQPFNFLEPWMSVCALSALEHGARIVELLPVRFRRRWWPVWASHATQVVYLADFAFVGEKNNYPESCALLAFNCEIPRLGVRETWRGKL